LLPKVWKSKVRDAAWGSIQDFPIEMPIVRVVPFVSVDVRANKKSGGGTT
jgi:hypothetical protein